MKKTKQILAIILFLALLVNILPPAPTHTQEVQAAATSAVRYVSASGSDSNNGTTTSTAYKTLKQAITALNDATADERIIKIVGDYTWDRDDTETHAKMITIAGNTGTEKLTIGGLNIWHESGALKLENLVLNFTVAERGIYSYGNELVIGKDVQVAYNGSTSDALSSFYPSIGAGILAGYICQSTTPHKLTLSSGRFYNVFLGDTGFHMEDGRNVVHTIPGVDFTMNAGATAVNIKVGGNGANACNSYTDNVNLVLNGGTYAYADGSVQLAGTDITKLNFNGNAVQLILNNGCTPTINSNFTAENIAACGDGVYYRINCAKATDGSILETTDTAGTYKVNGSRVAIATDAAGKTYESVDGILSVPEAGTYSVTWRHAGAVYVDATNGLDSNPGTQAAPVQTMKQAMALETREIKVIGSYDWQTAGVGDYTAHTQMIRISGSDSSAKLNINGDRYVQGGPVTFENIILNGTRTWPAILAQGNETVIGSGVNFTYDGAQADVNSFMPVVATGSTQSTQAEGSGVQKLSLSGGNFDWVCIGNYDVTSDVTIPGVNFTMNDGATVDEILIGGGSGTAVQSFTGNVNLVFNGGTVTKGINFKSDYDESRQIISRVLFNGNAVQLICNNGVNVSAPQVTENSISKNRDGVFYRLNCAARAGSSLEPTETAGVYKVNGDALAVATNTADATKVYTSTPGGVLRVESSGTYTVTWKETATVYVDAEDGSDDNAGTIDAPFKTLAKAVGVVEDLAYDSKNIRIIGSYAWGEKGTDYTTHSSMITISGADASARLDIGGNRFVHGGPMRYENIILNFQKQSNGIYALGNEVELGYGVTVTYKGASANLSTFYPILGTGTHYNTEGGAAAGVQKLTMNGGRFYQVYLGDNYQATGTSTVPGVVFTMNTGATVTQIILGGDGASPHNYSGNVNLTFNGGNLVSGVTITNTASGRVDFGGNAVQVIHNNGFKPKMSNNVSQEAIAARGGHLYQMNCAAVDGSTLAMTDQTGVYTVTGSKVAVAVNQNDARKVYFSENGTLKVEAEGVYDVSFQDATTYINAGTKIVVYAASTIDISALEVIEIADQLFVGWADANGNAVKTGSFPAGSVIVAKYLEFGEEDFRTIGTQIAKVSNVETDVTHLRFCAKISNSLLANLRKIGTVSYGIVHQEYEVLGVETLTIENGITASGDNNIIANDGTRITFAASEENIKLENSRDAYIYKAFLKYKDLQGTERVLYTDYKTASEYLTAKKLVQQKAMKQEADKTYFRSITSKADVMARQDVASWTKEDVTAHKQAGKAFDLEKMLEVYNGGFYEFTTGDAKGLIVRELNIEGVNPDKKDTPVKLVHVTDMHLNYVNEQDKEENNPVIMGEGGTYEKRVWLKDGASYANAVRAMNYAGRFDQVVVTGDTADYLSWGCLDLTRRATWELYPDAMVTIGNHEPVRRCQGTIADYSTLDSRYKILEDYWKHDIYYSSKVLQDKVMIIQMDNTQERFWDSQIAPLKADLEKAVENKYTVLMFMHIGIDTRDGVETATALWDNGGGETWELGGSWPLVGRHIEEGDTATKQVIDLIASHGDVVRGVFAGDMHSDYYVPITATTSTGKECTIPQYVLTGNAYEKGHVIKINVN